MAKTLKGRTVWIAVTAPGGDTPEAQNDDLNLAGYEGLDWTQIKNCGMLGESGPSTNLPTYDEFDTVVVQKSKGLTDAGSPTLEVSLNLADDGQNALRAAALPTFVDNVAIKWADLDGVIHYQRGLVTGPTAANGRVEDFRTQTFTLGLNQLEIIDS